MINHHIVEENIHVLEVIGDLTVKDLENFLDYFLTVPDLPENVKVLYDLREGRITFSIKEIEKLLKVADRARKSFKSLRTAILTNGKFETAISMIVKFRSAGKSREREVFSTYDAAIKWLNS